MENQFNGSNSILALSTFLVFLFLLASCQADPPVSNTPAALPEPAADYEENPYPWGFVDSTGDLVIRARYDEVRPFSEGLALVRTKGHWGYINKEGRLQIPATYPAAWPFVDGRARAQNDVGQFGYINTTGDWAIPANYQSLSEFKEGLAHFREGEKFGYINTKGQIVIKPQFTKAGPFHNGQAVVATDRAYGIINTKGETVLGFEHERLKPFSGKYARAREQGQYGYLNKHGNWAIPPSFRQASDFQGGIAAVAEEDRWGLIDEAGNWQVQPQYDQLFYAGEERWIAALGSSYFLLSSTGEKVSTTTFAEIQPFAEGLAAYQLNELWGYLRPDGSLMCPPEYYLAWPFRDGLGRVATRYGLTFINQVGRQLFEPRPHFFELRDFSEGLAPVEIY